MTVGVHDDAGRYIKHDGSFAEGAKIANVAYWLEYGTQYMPARPFFYPALRNNERRIQKLIAEALVKIGFQDVPVGDALRHVGARIVGYIQNVIKSNVQPELSGTWSSPDDPSRGTGYLGWRRAHYPRSGSNTLIASGLLLRSIRYQITLTGDQVLAMRQPKADSTDQAARAPKGPRQTMAGRDEHGRYLKRDKAATDAARNARNATAKDKRAAARLDAQAAILRMRQQRLDARTNPDEHAAAFERQLQRSNNRVKDS